MTIANYITRVLDMIITITLMDILLMIIAGYPAPLNKMEAYKMKKLHIHNSLLAEFEHWKKAADYCIPKGSNEIGSNFDCKWKHRSLADEIKFAKQFKLFIVKNEKARKQEFINKMED